MRVLYKSASIKVVEEAEDGLGLVRKLFVAPTFEFPIGVIKPEDPGYHVQEFTRQLTYAALCAANGVRRALFLGLGAGIVVNAVRSLFPQASIDIVDVSEEMLRVSQEHFFDIHSPNVTLFTDSALPFVLQGGLRYDYICCDIYNADLDIRFEHHRSHP